MKKRAVSPNPSPLARFFPPFAAGKRSPGSKERVQKQAARKFRADTPRERSGFTKPCIDRERRVEINHHIRCQAYHRASI